jgi:hypothetical protein
LESNRSEEKNMAKIIYLAKENDDLCSHCSCETAYITFPPQMDCPWCGCGWLFSCITCRKAFTFARGVEVDESWDELARRDLAAWHRPPTDEDVEEWIKAMKALLSKVEVGKQYICLDGYIIPTDASGVRFRGWHSEHDLDFVPQVAALDDYFVMENILSSVDYWRARAIPREDR